MALLRQTLRTLCSPDGWTYAVFWKLKRRNRMVLTWEDGYCSMDAPTGLGALQSGDYSNIDGNLLGMAVAKMSYHIYSFGEGVVGRVAFSGKHQWIFAPRTQGVPGMDSRHGFSSTRGYGGCTGVDKYPSGWDDQFAAGVKTIAVIAVPEGVLQLGSSRSMPEDLKFVSHVCSLFGALQTVPGAFLSDLFSEKSLKAKAFPASDAATLAASGFPPDLAAALGDCNPQNNFRDISFPGALTHASHRQNLQMSAPLAPPAPAAPPPVQSLPLAQNPLAASSPSDLFSLLGLAPDGCPIDPNTQMRFTGAASLSSASLKPPQSAAEPKRDAASLAPDMRTAPKRARLAPERTTRASVAIDQIQLNFFGPDAVVAAPLPQPVERRSSLPPPRQASPSEASAHVLGPSGELLARGAAAGGGAGGIGGVREAGGVGGQGTLGGKPKAVVDLEEELRMFHDNFLNDSAFTALPSPSLPSATLPSARASAQGSMGNLDEQLLGGMAASAHGALLAPPMLPDSSRSAGLSAPRRAGSRAEDAAAVAALASHFNSGGGGGGGGGDSFGGADELAQALGLHFTGQLPADLADLGAAVQMPASARKDAVLGRAAGAGAGPVPVAGTGLLMANGQFGGAMGRGVFAQPAAATAGGGGGRLAAEAGELGRGFSVGAGPQQSQPQTGPQKQQAQAQQLQQPQRVGGGRRGSSLAEMEQIATMEAFMRTSGLLPPLSLAELQQGAKLGFSSNQASMAAAAAAAGAGSVAGAKQGSRAVGVGAGLGDGKRGAKSMAGAAVGREASRGGAMKLEAAIMPVADMVPNAGALEQQFAQEMGVGAAAATVAAGAKEEKRGTKKRAREEKPKQRPRDRQLIQDRVKDLREIVPNSERLSIDGLLERTIQHLVFLREFSALRSDIEKGQQLLLEEMGFEESFSDCPVSVQHLSPTLVQIKVEWVGGTVPIDLADGLRQIGLVVRKSTVKSVGGRVKAQIVAECKQPVERMEIMWHVLQYLKDKLPDLAGILAAAGTDGNPMGSGKVDTILASRLHPVGVTSA